MTSTDDDDDDDDDERWNDFNPTKKLEGSGGKGKGKKITWRRGTKRKITEKRRKKQDLLRKNRKEESRRDRAKSSLWNPNERNGNILAD